MFLNGTYKRHNRGEIIGSGQGSHTAACLTLRFRHAQALFRPVIGERDAEILKEQKRLVPVSRQTVHKTANRSFGKPSSLSGLTDRKRILSGGLFEKGVIARPERQYGFGRQSGRAGANSLIAGVSHLPQKRAHILRPVLFGVAFMDALQLPQDMGVANGVGKVVELPVSSQTVADNNALIFPIARIPSSPRFF